MLDTQQRSCRVLLFVECSALGKPPLCRVPVVCRVLSLWHSANSLFAECPIKSTRQSLGHSTKKPSPVVKETASTFQSAEKGPKLLVGSQQRNPRSSFTVHTAARQFAAPSHPSNAIQGIHTQNSVEKRESPERTTPRLSQN